MDTLVNLLSSSVAVIGGADGPTQVVAASADLPLPAIVVSVFAVLFIAYVYIAKAINSKKAPVAKIEKQTSAAPAINQPVARDSVLLENVDEKDAAVIMAIVSDKSGIPLERLAFSSIKLMEDK